MNEVEPFLPMVRGSLFTIFLFLIGTLVAAAEEARDITNLGVKAMDAGQHEKAIKLFKKAAQAGEKTAANNLALIYKQGEIVEQDLAQSFQWRVRAADLGHDNAQIIVGWAYEQGSLVTKNQAIAFRYYKLAAQQGRFEAQYLVAQSYFDGKGVKQDNGLAALWYRFAAEQGSADSQTMLGYLYQEGLGVDRNANDALFWYRLASEQGNGYAIEKRSKLEKELPSDSLSQVELRLQKWRELR